MLRVTIPSGMIIPARGSQWNSGIFSEDMHWHESISFVIPPALSKSAVTIWLEPTVNLATQVMHCAQEQSKNLSFIMMSTMEKSLKNPRETVQMQLLCLDLFLSSCILCFKATLTTNCGWTDTSNMISANIYILIAATSTSHTMHSPQNT